MASIRGFGFKNRNLRGFSPDQKAPKTNFRLRWPGCRIISDNNGSILKNLRKYIRLIRNNFTLNPKHVFFFCHHVATLFLLNTETKKQFADNYGDFHRGRDLHDYRLLNPISEGELSGRRGLFR